MSLNIRETGHVEKGEVWSVCQCFPSAAQGRGRSGSGPQTEIQPPHDEDNTAHPGSLPVLRPQANPSRAHFCVRTI